MSKPIEKGYELLLLPNGFLLPTELQWHRYENSEVGETSGNLRIFTDVSISEQGMTDDFYAMPKGAAIDGAGMN